MCDSSHSAFNSMMAKEGVLINFPRYAMINYTFNSQEVFVTSAAMYLPARIQNWLMSRCEHKDCVSHIHITFNERL